MLNTTAANVYATSERFRPLDIVKSRVSTSAAVHALPSSRRATAAAAVKLATLRQTSQDACMSAVESMGGLLGKDRDLIMLSMLAQHELAQHSDGTHCPSLSDPVALMDTLSDSTRRVLLARTALMADTEPEARNDRRSTALRRSSSSYLKENTRRNILFSSVASALLFSANLNTQAAELDDDTIVEGVVRLGNNAEALLAEEAALYITVRPPGRSPPLA
eukprot:CAMPEP_0118951028 /NCGR_PEP_ID=MMETSP1169-20130426/52397_1 /TAXON_ID=36882 /ORGANISM="Pyramimonas obovata, Strain CCMP722" /LENGTH=219 /DNA_ID=CAMNT_0006897993 /DNA_START=219 /DNA_END=875 /DNA_ORIENTATION=-